MNKRALLLIGFVVALVALGGSAAFARMMAPPSNLDLSTERTSAQQHFDVAYTPSTNPPPINQLHTWTIRVTTPDGQPVEGATIDVDGDMPQHGHGLPTRPQVTRYLGDGRYLVEGMKFQMGGWWVADFTITDAAGQTDTVRFNFILG
jgi:YtkA-like